MICENCGHHNKEIRKIKNPIKDNAKMCSKCHENKSVDQYDTHAKGSDRLRPECKDCRKIMNAVRYQERKAKKENASIVIADVA